MVGLDPLFTYEGFIAFNYSLFLDTKTESVKSLSVVSNEIVNQTHCCQMTVNNDVLRFPLVRLKLKSHQKP